MINAHWAEFSSRASFCDESIDIKAWEHDIRIHAQ